jgi:tryptophanyl-tRNA synthetase
MSKSIGTTVGLQETPEQIWDKLRPAVTDPARQRKTDAGEPERCATIYQLHRAFSPAETVAEVEVNCRGAKWGCIDCKKVLHRHMVAELTPIRERAAALQAEPARIREALDAGAAKARVVASRTIDDVKQKMGLPLA